MDISIISLNLNGAAFIQNFLDSVWVEIEGNPDVELVLLDNGSTDNSLSIVLNEYPWVRLVQSPKNLGFTGGCHKAVEECESKYLVFLNNDMVLEPGFLNEILKPLEDESIGAVAGLILNDTGTMIDYAGGDVNLFGWGFQKYHNEPIYRIEEIFFDESIPQQFFPCGGAVAIRYQTWLDSGGFDKRYFAFFEDVDFGWRLNLMGLKTVLATKALVKHIHHGTAYAMPVALRSFLLERNALISVIKNYSDENLAKYLPWAIAMMNERALIESDTSLIGTFRGRWFEDVFSDYLSDTDSHSPTTLKDSGIQTAKRIIKMSRGDGKYPVSQLALEYVFQHWTKIMEQRKQVQMLRKVDDDSILDLINEKYRTVLGHIREKKLMEEFAKYVQV